MIASCMVECKQRLSLFDSKYKMTECNVMSDLRCDCWFAVACDKNLPATWCRYKRVSVATSIIHRYSKMDMCMSNRVLFPYVFFLR